jgi:cytoskeletal protein RodZ
MQSVGTRLREAREKKGYSLDDINVRTRINSKNLIAIETDEVRKISSPFFYRSFVRQYAEAVGLEFVTLAPGVESLAGHMRQPDLPGQGEHQIVRAAPLKARVKRDWSWVLPTAVLLAIVAIGSGGYSYLRLYKPSLLQYSVVSSLFSKPAAENPVPVPSAPVQTPAPPVAEAEANDLPTDSEVTTAAADKIHLELAATERTWLSVSADGKPAYTGILEPAQKKVLEGQDSARLRTGNAGGVSIVFNGKSIGTIGPRGTTRTVVFSKTGYLIESSEGATLTPANHIGG